MRSGRCDEFHDWGELLGGGRSIAGALLFGFLGVEAAKPLLRYDIPPNDRFAIILPFSIGLGRIGCLIVGCCRGEPWDGPWAITYADGIPRHPAPVYEMLFHWAMGFLLIALWRRQILFGRLFALYLLSYGVFRFLTEFLRETPKAFGGMSAYQIMGSADDRRRSHRDRRAHSASTSILGALENTSDGEPMNEEKDPKPEGHEQDFSEFAKHSRPQSNDKAGDGSGGRLIHAWLRHR